MGPSIPRTSVDWKDEPLFKDSSLVEVRILTDMKELLRDRGEERSYHPAQITYEGLEEGKMLPVELKVRGNFRRSRANCAFPPIRLKFKKDSVKQTLFHGQKKLKLVTHCQNSASFEQFLVQEYLVYRMYNQLTDASFRVRMVKVSYEDVNGKGKPILKYGFLIEDEKDVAKRAGGDLVEVKNIHPRDCQPHNEVLVSLFAFMIGNTDWSIPNLHNVKMVQPLEVGKGPIAVPYDFDWSGIINAPYANPNPTLGLDDVTDRLYRGFKQSPDRFDTAFALFNEKKAAIYALYNNNPYLKASTQKKAIRYLDKFYEIINSEKTREKLIISQCRTDR
ncbi:MAG: hypothetical protein AAF206_27760 [Bacteroidota bacterium]